jgi:hypothetical protein
MARVSDEGPARISDPNSIDSQIREFIALKQSLGVLEKREAELRQRIFEHIETNGEEDDKGHYFIELPEAISGVTRIEKQRRVSRKLDEDTAKEIIEEKNLEEKLYKTVQIVDEDAVMAAHYEGELTEEDIDQMFPAKIVWAIKTVK